MFNILYNIKRLFSREKQKNYKKQTYEYVILTYGIYNIHV